MKKISVILVFVLLISCLPLLFGCAKVDVPDTNVDEAEEKVGTGYPSGQIQREYIYYDGAVWVYDSYTPEAQRLEELPTGAYLIGQTLENNPYEIPSEDFHTAHIVVGQNIYITSSGDAIYIESSNNVYYRYVQAE